MVRHSTAGLLSIWICVSVVGSDRGVAHERDTSAETPPVERRAAAEVNPAQTTPLSAPDGEQDAPPVQPEEENRRQDLAEVLEGVRGLLYPFSLTMLVASSLLFVVRSLVCRRFPRRCVCPLVITGGAVLLSAGLVSQVKVLFLAGLIVVSCGHLIQAGWETVRTVRNLWGRLFQPRELTTAE